MKTIVRWIFRTILALVCLLVIFFLAVSFLSIPIDLTRFKPQVENAVGQILQRPVFIEESIIISTSLKPVVTLRSLRIGNPEEFSEEDLIFLDMARVQLELLPLLKKKIHLSEVHINTLDVNLIKDKSGQVNWATISDDTAKLNDSEEKIKKQTEIVKAPPEVFSDTIVVKKLTLEDISFKYSSIDIKEPYHFNIERLDGSMLPGKPLKLETQGKFLSFPYNLEIDIASLSEILTDNNSWMKVQAEIAQTNLTFSGNVDLNKAHRSLTLQAGISGDSLQSLNRLLRLDLPPLEKYGVETKLYLKEDHQEMQNLIVKVGSSSLNGDAVVVREANNISINLNLSSSHIQVDDFTVDDWNWIEDEPVVEPEHPASNGVSQKEPIKKDKSSPDNIRLLFDPEVLEKFDASLAIQADMILSGEDELGSGSIKANLKDGRIAIEPVLIKLPGGVIEISTSFKPGTEKSDASLKMNMSNFDIGILARRNKPDAKMSGLVNLNIDLRSSASTPKEMLENGNGYIDFSGQLKDINAGIIDLWAVNLVAAIVSNTEKNQSQINCTVGRWSVTDGYLNPDIFFIDTSKIRICGKGNVDLKKEQVDLLISPRPKRPEFFSLATPLKVQGSFDSIKMGIKKGGMVGTVIKFITSPIHVPIKRVFTGDIPQDGSDACMVELGPENRTEMKIQGCN